MAEIIYNADNPGEFAEKKEKHIPVIEIDGSTVKVRVGIEEHPMEPTHYIEWIALYRDGEELARRDLTPDDEPEATFDNIKDTDKLRARERCNVHGTWESN